MDNYFCKDVKSVINEYMMPTKEEMKEKYEDVLWQLTDFHMHMYDIKMDIEEWHDSICKPLTIEEGIKRADQEWEQSPRQKGQKRGLSLLTLEQYIEHKQYCRRRYGQW